MDPITVYKYEGLGNDFLILFDPDRRAPYDAQVARLLCERHRGVGADGLVRLARARHGADVLFELRNADGSVAETSGNGLRCALLAAVHHGWCEPGREVTVETIVGRHVGVVEHVGDSGGGEVRVTMGVATLERRPEFDLEERRAYAVEIGNPHLVLVGAKDDGVRALSVGPDLELAVAGGQNVEVATVTGRADLDVDTWERGAGYTLACGTGSCASAAAARLAGLVDDRVEVHNPGGDVAVELAGPPSEPQVVLAGAAQRVAAIEVALGDLAADGARPGGS